LTTLLGHGCLAAALAPFAVTESIVSSLRGRGATLMMLARKGEMPPAPPKSFVSDKKSDEAVKST
jgi:hypothetical protein